MDGASVRRELAAGGLLALVGVGVVLEARRHAIGSLGDMQAGYVPLVLGVSLIGLGVLTAVVGLAAAPRDGQDAFTPVDVRGCSAIIGSVAVFAALGRYAGLLPATFVAALIAAAGDRTTSVKGAVVLALTLSLVAGVLFSYALKMPFPLVRW